MHVPEASKIEKEGKEGEDQEEEKEKTEEVGIDPLPKNQQIAVVVKLISLASMIQVSKAQEDEEGEETEGNLFPFLMVMYTLLIVIFTVLVQFAWKVGVRMWHQPQGFRRPDSRSHPARGSAGKKGREEKEEEEEESEHSLRRRVSKRLQEEEKKKNPDEAGVDCVRSPVQLSGCPGEGGLDQSQDPVRLPGSPVKTGRDQGGQGSRSNRPGSSMDQVAEEAQEEERREITQDEINEIMEQIGREEDDLWAHERVEYWAQERVAPLPDSEGEENFEERVGFRVLRTAFGVVYHLQPNCSYLQNPKVGVPREYKWCGTCMRIALQTRGRPPPGCSLFLQDSGNTFHSDQRCPRNEGTKLVRCCLKCRDRL